ncbi:hypothetical protein [Trinickia mobilis]|uniref:hypothetical protein n=1 Tax=Trinickia mobilis TaxID=2816356 RepID=UPI001A8D48D0|nr:hypothetical protein [Trinickia mobilis]
MSAAQHEAASCAANRVRRESAEIPHDSPTMDEKTLAAYDQAAASFADDWIGGSIARQ